MEAIIINIEETRKMGTFEQFLEIYGLEEVDCNILSARKESWLGLHLSEVPV
ncbi:MAG: hypothetical protein R6U40_13250 [Desulfobacterales bacterium]